MNFSKGYIVPLKDEVVEGYDYKDKTATANVSYEKMRGVILDFIAGLVEPCFFILELPATRQQEETLRADGCAPFHSNVYYADGLSKRQLLEIMNSYGEILINDGVCEFGFASHITRDEIFVCKYNIVKIFSTNEAMIKGLFDRHNIPRRESLMTAWDTFSQTSPGDSKVIEIDGLTCYDLVDKLESFGLYFAEIR